MNKVSNEIISLCVAANKLLDKKFSHHMIIMDEEILNLWAHARLRSP